VEISRARINNRLSTRYITAFYCHETVIRGKCFSPDKATRPWIRHYSTAGLVARREQNVTDVLGWIVVLPADRLGLG
jgi:hypothetical protein